MSRVRDLKEAAANIHEDMFEKTEGWEDVLYYVFSSMHEQTMLE